MDRAKTTLGGTPRALPNRDPHAARAEQRTPRAAKLDQASDGEFDTLDETGNKDLVNRLSVAVKEAKTPEPRWRRWFEEAL